MAPLSARQLDALVAERDCLRDFAELSADWFWEQDAEFRFTQLSGHALGRLGYLPERLVGQRRWDLPFLPADADAMAAHRAACERHEIFYRFEYDIVAESGEIERYSISGKPVFSAAGKFCGYRGIGRNITELHRARRALSESEATLGLIFDNALVGISYQRNRIIERCNRRMEELFGWPPGGLLGQSTRVLFACEADWRAAGEQVYRDGVRYYGEMGYVRPDGTPLTVYIAGHAIGDPADIAWVWIYVDVTARRQAEDALRRSHQELEARVAERTAELSAQLHFLQDLIEAIPGPLFYKNRAGVYLGCNRAFADYLGRRRESIIGQTAFELAPRALAEVYHAADEALYAAAAGRQVYESHVKGADGQARDVMFHKAVYRDAAGRAAGLIGIILDISERKSMEARLRQSATVFDSTADGVLIADGEGNIVAINRAFTEITGYAEADVLGRNPRLLKSGRQDETFYRQMWHDISHRGCWRGEVWNRRKDGSEYPEWLTISTVADPQGQVSHYVAVFSDITAIKEAQQRLDFQAHHDALTGLPNRLLLEARIGSAVPRARRDNKRLAMLFIDLDRFKNINDTLGHQVGDEVLAEVARRLSGVLRESDTLARLGGDEFVVLLEDLGSPEDASRVADKIIDSLRRCIVGAGQEFYVGASIGISLFPEDGESGTALLKNADVAMYRAKERGRNTFEFFTADLTEVSLERFRLEVDIRHAIERSELRVAFQPQYALADDRLIGAEALVRWQHPRLGNVPPAQFIPLAEESGLIVALGAWVLRQACAQWAAWIAAGHSPGILSVNVSGVEFRRGQVLETVSAALTGSGLAADRLSLEITESAIMDQAESAIGELGALRALGVRLAIDDFGTGYSSLAYLKRLPLDKLKIDQGFVRGLPQAEEDAAIVRAVIALAHSLQLATVAEGVESTAQHDFLRAAGCDEMQGYLRSRPLSVEDFGRLLGPRV